MVGRLTEGPARSMATAGPFSIPNDIKLCTIGISVKVAKYMKAPKLLAIRFEI